MVPDESLKEVVQPVDCIETLIVLHKRMGHIGLEKLYFLAYGLYEWMHLSKGCVSVVKGCIGCQASKVELGDLPLKPTSKG